MEKWLCVSYTPAEVPDLVIKKLAIDHIYVWSNHSDKDHDTIICNQNLFQTQSILKKWTKKPKKIINTDSLELITRLVNEGIGFGIIPERAVLLSEFSLKKVNSLPTYKDNICLVYRPEFGKAPAEKLTAEALKMGILTN